MIELLKAFDKFLWGMPLILGILGVGIYISIKTGGIQFRKLSFALRHTLGNIFEKDHDHKSGDISPFQAVATALIKLSYDFFKDPERIRKSSDEDKLHLK